MTPQQSTVTASQAARLAAEAAGQSTLDAAANAAKKGTSTSEFKATLLGIIMTGALAALHQLAVIPSPIAPYAAGVSIAIAAGAYALSRGNVKAAALQAAGAVASQYAPASAQPLIRAGTAVIGAAIGAQPEIEGPGGG